MLQALASEKKQSFLSSTIPPPKARVFAPPVPSFSNQSRLGTLQRKPDCACGGQCGSCQAKKTSAVGYEGDLDDGVYAVSPEDAAPAPSPEAPTEASPMDDSKKDKPAKPPSCDDVCERAYKDPNLNKQGGGVICDHGAKCPCVFDVSPLKRGQCPDLDADILAHETKHMPGGDCPSDPAPSRLKPRDPKNLTKEECEHRKASVKNLESIIPKSKGDCKTGIQTIHDRIDTWVKANC
jgi:hypothetical protein